MNRRQTSLAAGAFAIGMGLWCLAAAGAETPVPPKGAPEYQAPPRPADGAQMALTVQKLEKGFDPGRPLLVWAIGSSFTNGLGGGDLLAELVRQRFPQAHNLVPEDLLGDAVHESRYASRMTVMNIARHFHRAGAFRYDPASRERRVEVEAPGAVELSAGPWTATHAGAARTATTKGSAVSLSFTGNRVELIGWRGPDGGTADVWIDGRPAGEFDAFYAGYILPDKKNAPRPPNPPRDRAPHMVSLGRNLVPQQWTLAMLDDECNYELVGSVTGPDGRGNGLKPFTSTSGQIVVEPEFWRDAKYNRAGDRFTFDVERTTVGSVEFKAPAAEKFRLRLAWNLANGPHVLKIVARGDGAVTLDAFDVFEPPLK